MNTQVVYFIHVIGALSVGFYLILPFVFLTMRKLTPHMQVGFLRGLRTLNLIGQWLLIVQFVSGGYLIGKNADAFTVPWMISVCVVFVLLGAASGMMGAALKRSIVAHENGQVVRPSDPTRILVYSILAAGCVIYLVFSMVFPYVY